MKRFSSQLLFCTPETLKRKTVVEQDDDGRISKLIDLETRAVETAGTIFYDGVISCSPISLSLRLTDDDISRLPEKYEYLSLKTTLAKKFKHQTDKKTIVDFGTENGEEINNLLKVNAGYLDFLDIISLIAGSVYFPAIIAGLEPGCNEGKPTHIFLWQGIDMLNFKLKNTSVADLTEKVGFRQ